MRDEALELGPWVVPPTTVPRAYGFGSERGNLGRREGEKEGKKDLASDETRAGGSQRRKNGSRDTLSTREVLKNTASHRVNEDGPRICNETWDHSHC